MRLEVTITSVEWEKERIGEGLGKRFTIAVCTYIVEEARSGTWRARLRAEARTPLHAMVRTVESADMSASWDASQARVVSMRMSWHAVVVGQRR